MGSPPRVREKLVRSKSGNQGYGITPACAGKTHTLTITVSEFQDHPRVCGKNFLSVNMFDIGVGSPPRVREKLSPTLAHSIKSRITPACAGKTEILTIHSTFKRDHPRVCGKNSWITLRLAVVRGSPPRVREKR